MTIEQTTKAFGETVSPAFTDSYNALHGHIGHEIKIQHIWDWATNREIGIEIRCAEPSCALSEPLLEIDTPRE